MGLIAITGASSHIGRAVVSEFVDCGHEVVGLVRQPVRPTDVRYQLSDALDTSKLRGVTTFVHLAWDRGLRSETTNRIGIDHLIHAANEVDAKVILLSTLGAASPTSRYTKSKSEAERKVLDSGGTVLRVGLVKGEEPFGLDKVLLRFSRLPLNIRELQSLESTDLAGLANALVGFCVSEQRGVFELVSPQEPENQSVEEKIGELGPIDSRRFEGNSPAISLALIFRAASLLTLRSPVTISVVDRLATLSSPRLCRKG